MTFPFGAVLHRTLALCSPGVEHTRLSNYGDKRCFKVLWSLDPGAIRSELGDENGTILIFWDSTPYQKIGTVTVANYLSPFDWAVAMESSDVAPRVRVLVLDPEWEAAGKPASFLRASYRHGHRPIPWFDVVNLRQASALTDALKALHRLRVKSFGSSIAGDSVGQLRDLWVGSLARGVDPENHHSIANLLGPELLLGELGKAEPALGALNGLLARLQVLPSANPPRSPGRAKSSPRSGLPWFPKHAWRHTIDRFILVDDMVDSGWDTFLRQALEADAELEGHRTPDVLLELLSSDVGRVARRGGVDGEQWDRSVLILDLRLFAGSEADEREFITKLTTLAERLAGGFRFEPLARIRRAIDGGRLQRSTSEYLDALALLPALMAHFDPLLPIVVFSSTRQRGVVRHLSGIPNVILDFQKPVLDGRPYRPVIEETRAGFIRALSRAVAVARVRSLCRHTSRSPSPLVVRPAPLSVRGSADRGWPSVHVFIDESGATDGLQNDLWRRQTFAVGGLCLFLPDESPEALRQVNDALLQEGLFWGLASGQKPLKPFDPMPAEPLPKHPDALPGMAAQTKDDVAVGWMERVEDCVRSCGAAVAAFALEAPRGSVEGDGPDILYRKMLREVLTLLLSTILPRYLNPSGSLGVHVATKASSVWPRHPVTRVSMTPDEAVAAYGVHVIDDDGGSPPQKLFASFGADDVHPLMLDVQSALGPNRGKGYKVVRARGVRLVNCDEGWQARRAAWARAMEGGARPDDPRLRFRRQFTPRDNLRRPEQIHYAADFLARLARTGTSGVVRRWFEAGFHDCRETASLLIEAVLSDCHGKPEEALERLFRAADRLPSPGSLYGETSIARWVRADSTQWVRGVAQQRTRVERLISRMKP